MTKNVFALTELQKRAIETTGWKFKKEHRTSDDRTIIVLILPLTEVSNVPNETYTFSFDAAFVKDFEKTIRDSAKAFNPEGYAVARFQDGQKGLEQLLKEGKYIKEKLEELVAIFDNSKHIRKRKKEFEDKCYEAYKLHWMLSHGHTLSEYVKGVAESADEVDMLECPPKKRTTREQLVYDSENYFVYETGFENGSCYVCKDEFLQAEFLDKDYMHGLLGLMENGASLKAFYDDHYVEEEKPEEGEKPFWVAIRVDGRFIPTVFAKNIEEAKEKAQSQFLGTDFVGLDDIVDSECIYVENEDGDYVWEK